MLKKVIKFALASTLIVSGLVIGTTIFTVKGIDKLGDKLEDTMHN